MVSGLNSYLKKKKESIEIINFIKVYLNINSDIVVENMLPIFNKKTKTMASVSHPIDGVFTISICFNGTDYGFVRRLAHECVHIKQMEDGRLKHIGSNKFSFDGEPMSFIDYATEYKDNNNIPKFEEEAFAMECKIANAYLSSKLH